eukprot:c598_g1_i1.p1 GENE.c598_g1_i1~~c598_g1_i1.p1  ORF type:complete len:130 (+),score=54.04 c598_g1_i1:33-392(+)
MKFCFFLLILFILFIFVELIPSPTSKSKSKLIPTINLQTKSLPNPNPSQKILSDVEGLTERVISEREWDQGYMSEYKQFKLGHNAGFQKGYADALKLANRNLVSGYSSGYQSGYEDAVK